jgi:hypothetical protein
VECEIVPVGKGNGSMCSVYVRGVGVEVFPLKWPEESGVDM